MKKFVNKKAGLFVLLSAIVCLCAAALGVTAFTQKSAAYAQTTEVYTAPLAYEYVAEIEEDAAYYKVTGVDITAMQEQGGAWKTAWGTAQRNNISIEIPAMYNDNTNGEAPVKTINESAFDEDSTNNTDFDFKALDLSSAANLEIIEKNAFRKSQIDGELYIPSSIKKIANSAFFSSKSIKSIVFGDDIGEVEFASEALSGIVLNDKEIEIPALFKPIIITNTGKKQLNSYNIFSGVKGIQSFSVNEANETFYAEDGVLFAKEKDNNNIYLYSYPSGKRSEAYIVPADVTVFSGRLFTNTSLELVVCPATLQQIGPYAFSSTGVNVFLDPHPDLVIYKAYSFYVHSGKIIVPNEKIRTDALAGDGVLNNAVGVKEENVLYLSDLTVESKDEIDTSFDAEAVKSNLNVTATTNGDEPISLPLSDISDFNIVLPDGGLIGGDNTITVACKWLSKDFIVNVTKITPTAPAAPTVSGTPTANSITLTAIEGAEYSLDGVNWQDSPTFTGLAANTEYTFIARIKETSAAHASAASAALTVKTDKITPTAPVAPTVSGTPTISSITLTAIEGAEYSIDGVTWQDSPTFTGLAANTEYTFYARIKATETANASEASAVLTIKTEAIPSDKGGLSGGAIAGIVIGSVLLAGILVLLALFLFRKDKSQGFKAYYAGLCGTCATTVKGWGGKIKALFLKDKEGASSETLPEDTVDQVPVESVDENDEPRN